MADIRDALTVAEAALAKSIHQVGTTSASLPTPCGDWDVRALVAHTLGTAELFASAVDGGAPPPEGALSGSGSFSDDAARDVLARSAKAWAAVGDLGEVLATPLGEMPAERLAAIATFSAVVHGWDLVAALGLPRDIAPGLLSAGGPGAEVLVPRLRPAGAFAAPAAVTANATPTEAFIASLGRDPQWRVEG